MSDPKVWLLMVDDLTRSVHGSFESARADAKRIWGDIEWSSNNQAECFGWSHDEHCKVDIIRFKVLS